MAQQKADLLARVEELTRAPHEAREQQSATAAALPAVARGSGELSSVLQALVEAAAGLCDADNAVVWLVEGDEIVLDAGYGPDGGRLPEGSRVRLALSTLTASRVVKERRTVHIPEMRAERSEGYR
jgi:hypothetical protein